MVCCRTPRFWWAASSFYPWFLLGRPSFCWLKLVALGFEALASSLEGPWEPTNQCPILFSVVGRGPSNRKSAPVLFPVTLIEGKQQLSFWLKALKGWFVGYLQNQVNGSTGFSLRACPCRLRISSTSAIQCVRHRPEDLSLPFFV